MQHRFLSQSWFQSFVNLWFYNPVSTISSLAMVCSWTGEKNMIFLCWLADSESTHSWTLTNKADHFFVLVQRLVQALHQQFFLPVLQTLCYRINADFKHGSAHRLMVTQKVTGKGWGWKMSGQIQEVTGVWGGVCREENFGNLLASSQCWKNQDQLKPVSLFQKPTRGHSQWGRDGRQSARWRTKKNTCAHTNYTSGQLKALMAKTKTWLHHDKFSKFPHWASFP